jgi:hypothetical protein
MSDDKPDRHKSTPRKKNEPAAMQKDAQLGRDVQTKIGEQLRVMYDDVVRQGVPDRFADLLKRLDDQDGGERGR